MGCSEITGPDRVIECSGLWRPSPIKIEDEIQFYRRRRDTFFFKGREGQTIEVHAPLKIATIMRKQLKYKRWYKTTRADGNLTIAV
jgi:hypothetical protein